MVIKSGKGQALLCSFPDFVVNMYKIKCEQNVKTCNSQGIKCHLE